MKYDIKYQEQDLANKYRYWIETDIINNLLLLKFETVPSTDDIKNEVDKYIELKNAE